MVVVRTFDLGAGRKARGCLSMTAKSERGRLKRTLRSGSGSPACRRARKLSSSEKTMWQGRCATWLSYYCGFQIS